MRERGRRNQGSSTASTEKNRSSFLEDRRKKKRGDGKIDTKPTEDQRELGSLWKGDIIAGKKWGTTSSTQQGKRAKHSPPARVCLEKERGVKFLRKRGKGACFSWGKRREWGRGPYDPWNRG